MAETRGRYGLTIVLGTLLGAKRARLRELGTDKYKSYGALSDHSEAELRTLISQMVEMGYLYQTQERYSVLRLGNITPLKDENTHVVMRTYEEKEPDKKKKTAKSVRKRSTDALTSAGYDLFEALRNQPFPSLEGTYRNESVTLQIDENGLYTMQDLKNSHSGLLFSVGMEEDGFVYGYDDYNQQVLSYCKVMPLYGKLEIKNMFDHDKLELEYQYE